MRGRGPWWRDKFDQQSVRLTSAREIVLEVLNSTDEHLSAADIYVQAHEINPSIGLTTVYRSLDILEQLGIAQKFDFGDGRARYELINRPGEKNHHHHLICVRCKKIIDYTEFIEDEIEFIENTQDKLSKKYNFTINDHVINFYGFCEECR